MLPPDPPPRMAPLTQDELTQEARDFLGRWSGGFFKNAEKNAVLMTFAHHPPVADLFSQLNIHILSTNTLPPRLRQIAIMRLAWVTRASFMWSSHLNTTVMAGVEPDFYQQVKVGADDPFFDEMERHVIIATEDLINDQRINDESWNVLMRDWTKQQMLDFLFTIGVYYTVAILMRTLGVQRHEELLELAEEHGAPDPV